MMNQLISPQDRPITISCILKPAISPNPSIPASRIMTSMAITAMIPAKQSCRFTAACSSPRLSGG